MDMGWEFVVVIGGVEIVSEGETGIGEGVDDMNGRTKMRVGVGMVRERVMGVDEGVGEGVGVVNEGVEVASEVVEVVSEDEMESIHDSGAEICEFVCEGWQMVSECEKGAGDSDLESDL